MITIIEHYSGNYKIDLSKPLDIAICIRPNQNNVNAFFAPEPFAEPVIAGDFIGSVEKGAPVNFFNLTFNPHGNGTHTECVGHISKEPHYVTNCFSKYFFLCEVISIYPTYLTNGDKVIGKEQLDMQLKFENTEAVVIRTLPNDKLKTVAKYSGQNPPYMEAAATAYLRERNIEHLLIDLPSVDREEDDGKLLAHKAFWNYPEKPRLKATITELIYVPMEITNGLYFINIQPAAIQMDAAPSKPVLYEAI